MQHPIRWPRPAWATPAALAIAWATLVAYGSLLPMQFNLARFLDRHDSLADAAIAWINSPTWRPLRHETSSLGVAAWQSDLALNLLLYVPLGLLVRWALSRGNRPAWRQITFAILAVASLSYLLECTQAIMPYRVASLNDVLANVLPAVVAIVVTPHVRLGFKRLTATVWRRIRPAAKSTIATLRQRPLLDALALAAAGLALYLAQPLTIGSAASIAAAPALPFLNYFVLPYDVAALALAESATAYALLTLLIAPLLGRKRLALAVPLVGAVVLIAELIPTLTAAARLDLTEPLLAAATAAALITTLIYAARTLTPRPTPA